VQWKLYGYDEKNSDNKILSIVHSHIVLLTYQYHWQVYAVT